MDNSILYKIRDVVFNKLKSSNAVVRETSMLQSKYCVLFHNPTNNTIQLSFQCDITPDIAAKIALDLNKICVFDIIHNHYMTEVGHIILGEKEIEKARNKINLDNNIQGCDSRFVN